MRLIGAADPDVEAAFGSVEDWRQKEVFCRAGPGSVVSPIHRAVESTCFVVQVEDKTFFAKLRQRDMRMFFDEPVVAAASRIASDAGVSPHLYHADPASGLLVYEYLDDHWAWGRIDRLTDADVLENVVRAKKRLHDGLAFAGDFDVFCVIRTYLEKVAAGRITVPADLPRIAAAVGEIGEAISAAGVDRKPCHADGVASNILIGPQAAIRLVDFDRAGNTDPYFDLGSLMVEAFQFENDERRILEIYDGTCSDAAYHRCKLYGIADDLMWALWGFICFHHSPRKDVEFTKYAEWRLLRARWNLGAPGFRHWLRHLG